MDMQAIGPIDPDKLYSGQQAARLLNVSYSSIRRYRNAGHLRGRRLTPASPPRYLGADLLSMRERGA